MSKLKSGLKMSDEAVEKLLGTFGEITETEEVRHVWKDGRYQGATVVYKNPIHPDLKEMFHPYIPLSIDGEPAPEQPTREFFIEHGFPVPGEAPPSKH
jgi:hypothetical protein